MSFDVDKHINVLTVFLIQNFTDHIELFSHTSAEVWQPVVKYSAGTGLYNSHDTASFWSNITIEDLTFPADNCALNLSEKCIRPYKQILTSQLWESNKVQEVCVRIFYQILRDNV